MTYELKFSVVIQQRDTRISYYKEAASYTRNLTGLTYEELEVALDEREFRTFLLERLNRLRALDAMEEK